MNIQKNKQWLENDFLLGIVSRKEAEEILNNYDNDILKNTIVISIVNPNNNTLMLDYFETKLDELENNNLNTIEINLNKKNGKIETKLITKTELLNKINILKNQKELQKINYNSKNFGLEDMNSIPIPLKLQNKVKDIITVAFWDIEEEIGHYKPLTNLQAQKIAKFIKKYKNNIGKDLKVLIHCSAGISRSAGTGLSVKCIVKHNGNKYDMSLYPCDIWNFNRYMPNLTVYDKIIEEYNNL